MRRHKRALYALLLPPLLALTGCGRPARGAEVAVLDIGKADAIIITSGNHAVLIDAGEEDDGEKILAYLKEKKIKALDAMIITHFDKDHVGGADWVLFGVPVGTVYDANYESASKQYKQFISAIQAADVPRVRVVREMTLSFGNLALTLMPTALVSEDENDLSLVVSMSDGRHTFLFMADATEPRIAELLSGGILPHDFVKMPHHGRYEKNLPAFLDAVRPRVAAITDGKEKTADDETLKALASRGVETYATRNGRILLNSDRKGLHARQ